MPVELRLLWVEREKSTIDFYSQINRVYFLGIQQFSATLQASKRAVNTTPIAVSAINEIIITTRISEY